MYPHPSPNTGWLTKRGLAILTLLGLSIILGLAMYVIASIKIEKRFQEKSSTAQEESKKKKLLKDRVYYDHGIETISIHLGARSEVKASEGQILLYVRTDQPMTEASRKVVIEKLGEITYINQGRIFTGPHGVAVEKISSRNDATVDPDEALIADTRLLNRILGILRRHAKFEVEE